ncbi:acyl-CoA reductase [Scopulibacillus cellulosilyticus]|uniref:Acyl-CoA reductase n=1 Tax=Scopulibacillus cellulosilyticus TaxID=2665665 RepID=A0ABW2PW65_9BACL
MIDKEGAQVIDAYFVPKGFQLTSFTERIYESEYENLILRFPVFSSGDISELSQTIKANRRNCLLNLKIAEVVDIIDSAVQKWLDPNYPFRQLAEKWLPVITGYHKEMIRLELKRFMRTFRKKELLRFLDEEFDNPAVLDEFRPRKTGGFSKAYGPKLIFHIFSGNVPGLPIWSMIMGLLIKSANIGKTSSSEPLMPVLFAQTLAEVNQDFADCLAVLPWKGGNIELEESVISEAEAVIVYGSSQSVEKVRSRVPDHKLFLSYGHKISFAMAGKEALTPDRYNQVAHRLAEDISVYDQQGCVSPHSVFIEEGGAVSPKQFAQLLAKELQRYHEKKPRAEISNEEALAIRAVRSKYEFEALNESEDAVYGSSEGTSWTVIYHNKTAFAASPLNRTVHVFKCTILEDSISFLEPYRRYLQTAGVAVGPERLFRLAEQLGEAGVNRICSIGEMLHTQPGWHHDGQLNFLDLIKWTDIEKNAEQDAENYDPDAE